MNVSTPKTRLPRPQLPPDWECAEIPPEVGVRDVGGPNVTQSVNAAGQSTIHCRRAT